MSEGWHAGDLALCVRDDWELCKQGRIRNTSAHPRSGGIYPVKFVFAEDDGVFLFIAEFEAKYEAVCFRKIEPLSEEERREALDEREPVPG